MEILRKQRFRLCAGAASLLLVMAAAEPAFAQAGSTLPDPAVPCPAFARHPGGAWTVMTPVTLDVAGMAMHFAPGTVFAPNSSTHGVAMHDILDRECGNLPGPPAAR